MKEYHPLLGDPAPRRRFRWRLWLTLLSLPALVLAGVLSLAYAGKKYVPIAKEATRLFHAQFSAGQDDLVLTHADSAWFRDADPEHRIKMLARIRRKMGSCTYGEPQRWVVNSSSQGDLVTLRYACRCANGPLEETFTWRVVDQDASLVSYQANSPILLTD